MATLNCEFCDQPFASRTNLLSHQKNAKYCLKLRGETLPNNIICEYCKKTFTRSQHLKNHTQTCKQLTATVVKSDEQSTIKSLELELDSQRLKYIAQRKELLSYKRKCKEFEKEIVILKESLAYEKGQIEVYQKSKPQVVNNNKNCAVNSKLSHIQITTIKPFTIEHISELLPQYTEERFRNKLAGIVALILPFTTLNVKGVTERNIVCTDLARTKCHVLNVDREWERDDGLTICSDIIKLFIPKMKEYMNVYDEKFEEANKHVNAESHSIIKTAFYAKHRQDFDYYFELIEDIRLGFYAPATRGVGDDYDTLVKKFRDALKPTIYLERPKKD